MKKYLLVSLAVLLTASFAWTEVTQVKVAEPKVDIEADATVTWGIDLGTNGTISPQHGFKNEGEFKVKVPLIDKQSSTSKGDGDVYAEVEVKDIELYIQAKHDKKGGKLGSSKNDPATEKNGGFNLIGNVGELSAKFVFYGAYLQIFDAPKMMTNYASMWEPLKISKPDEYDGAEYEDPFKFEPGFKGYGVKFGYMNKNLMDLDVGLKLVSNGDWEGKFDQYDGTAGKTVHSRYGLGFDLGMKPLKDLLAFNLGFNMTLAKAKDYKNGSGDPAKNLTADNLLFGIGAEVTSKPIDGLELKLGFDGAVGTNNSGDNFVWDMLFDTKYKWVSTGLYVASKYSAMDDLAVYFKFETKGEEKDPSFLLKGLDAGAYLGMFKLMHASNGTLPMLLKVWGSYKLALNDSMWIKPFATLWGETEHKNGTDKAFGLAYDLGVTFAPVEKVEITGKWAHGDAPEKNYHYAGQSYNSTVKNVLKTTATATDNQHNGKFTLAVKVKY